MFVCTKIHFYRFTSEEGITFLFFWVTVELGGKPKFANRRLFILFQTPIFNLRPGVNIRIIS